MTISGSLFYTPSAGLCLAYPPASGPEGSHLVSLYPSQLYSELVDPPVKNSDPPPSYGSECIIEELTAKNRPLRPITINFSQFPDSKKRAYSNGDSIIATLLIAPTIPINLESISVSFEAEEVVRKSSWSHVQFLRRHIKLANHDFLNLPQDSALLPGYLYSFPFSLEIPQIQSATACDNADPSADPTFIRQCHHNCNSPSVGFNHLKLPSTSGCHPNQSVSPLVDLASKTARVTYKLKPLVKGFEMHTGKPFVGIESDVFVKVLPSYPLPAQLLTPPPVPYTAFRQYTKKSGFSLLSSGKKSVGTIKLTINRYPILPIYTHDEETPKIALTLQYFPDIANTEKSTSPPAIHNVSLYLKARTISSCRAPISKPLFNPNIIKTYQVDNRLHELIDPTKGIKLSLNTDSSNTGTSSKSTKPTKNSKQTTTASTTDKKTADTPSHIPPDLKEEFKSYSIAFIDRLPKNTWRSVSSNDPVLLPNFTSATPLSTLSDSSPDQITYKKPYYETVIVVPANIPSNIKTYDVVPSYESCYTARDYTLVISVEFSTGSVSGASIQSLGSTSPMGSPIVLEVPAVVVTSLTSAINTPDLFAYYADAASLVTEPTPESDQESVVGSESSVYEAPVSEEEESARLQNESCPLSSSETLTGSGSSASSSGTNTPTTPQPSSEEPQPNSTENTNSIEPNPSARRTRATRNSQNTRLSRRGKKYLEVRPLPPKFGDTPPYMLKPSSDEATSIFGQPGGFSSHNDYPFPPPGIGLSHPNMHTTMMTMVGHYTGNQYHRFRENNGQYYPPNGSTSG